jgi:hypothetical protein
LLRCPRSFAGFLHVALLEQAVVRREDALAELARRLAVLDLIAERLGELSRAAGLFSYGGGIGCAEDAYVAGALRRRGRTIGARGRRR